MSSHILRKTLDYSHWSFLSSYVTKGNVWVLTKILKKQLNFRSFQHPLGVPIVFKTHFLAHLMGRAPVHTNRVLFLSYVTFRTNCLGFLPKYCKKSHFRSIQNNLSYPLLHKTYIFLQKYWGVYLGILTVHYLLLYLKI